MTGFGFGYRPGASRRLQGGVLATLSPASAWNGTEGSGFASVPADPTRTTAKPAMTLLTPPKQRTTSSIDVGVLAAANDSGSLFDTLGVEKVVFHLEGNTVEVTAPKWHAVPTPVGTRLRYGWFARLSAASNGYGNLYVEAVPRDSSMQSRVMGPYVYGFQAAPYDGELAIAPSAPEVAGSSYQTIPAAASYVKQQGWQTARLGLKEAGKYEFGANAPTAWDNKGWCEVHADVPGCSIGRLTYTDDTAARPDTCGLPMQLVGPDLTLDQRYVIEFNSHESNFWCNGINWTTTDPLGRFERLRGRSPDLNGWRIDGDPWITDCTISELAGACSQATLALDNSLSNMTYDIFGDTQHVILNTVDGHRGGFWVQDNPAVTVDGPAGATIERTGAVTPDSTVITLNEGGSPIGTFTCGVAESAFTATKVLDQANGVGYDLNDFVAWVNNLTGWTATLDDSDLADVVSAALSIPGNKGQGIPASTDASNSLALVVCFDRHSDFHQHATAGKENVLIALNSASDCQVQFILWSPTDIGGAAEERDMLAFGNTFHNDQTPASNYDPAANSSQLGRGTGIQASHVVVAANTFSQRVVVQNANANNTFDLYCLFTNNIAAEFSYAGGVPLANFVAKNSHLFAGASTPSGSTGISIGGTLDTLLADPANGDFTPQAELLTDGFAAVLPTDYERTPFPPEVVVGDDTFLAAPGGVAAAALKYAPPPPSADPVADLIASMDANPGDHAFVDYTDASDVPPWTGVDQSANGNNHIQSTGSRKPALSASGATFDGNNDAVVQSISGGTFTVAMAVTVNDPDDPGVFVSDNGNTTYVQYQSGSGVSHQATTVTVDGVATGTRGAVYTAVNGAGEVILVMQGLDLTGRSELRIGRNSGTMNATVRRVAVIAEAAMGSNLASARTLAAQAVAAT